MMLGKFFIIVQTLFVSFQISVLPVQNFFLLHWFCIMATPVRVKQLNINSLSISLACVQSINTKPSLVLVLSRPHFSLLL